VKKHKPTAAQLAYYARNKTASGRKKYAQSDEKKRLAALANAGHSPAALNMPSLQYAHEPSEMRANIDNPIIRETVLGTAEGRYDQGTSYGPPVTATAVQEGAAKYVVLSVGNNTHRQEMSDSLLFKLAMDCLRLVPSPRT